MILEEAPNIGSCSKVAIDQNGDYEFVLQNSLKNECKIENII